MSLIPFAGAVQKFNRSGGGAAGYQIERSLRFNSADDAYLTRTFASAGNKKTWTWSSWLKLGRIANSFENQDTIFNVWVDDNNRSAINIQDNAENKIDFFNITGGSVTARLTPTQAFRDFSAWYHVIFSIDTTQATDTNRLKMYVNGVQVTSFSTATYPSQNADLTINSAVAHDIGTGRDAVGAVGPYYYDGLMTEVNFIDGAAYDPTYFGEFNTDTGVWQPKAYSGSYGTNGFYLNFSDNTSTTTLGEDQAGSNDFTTSGFSVTAGEGNDSLVDVPTRFGTDTGVGGEVRGNYCTLNPLSTTAGTYTQGNLRYVGASSWRRSNATLAVSTGKWYWEVTLGNAPFSPRGTTSSYNAFGFGLSTVFNSTTQSSSATDAVYLADNGYYKNFSGSWTDGGTAFSSGDTLAVAVDLDANTFTFYRNNTQITTGTIGGTSGRELVPIILSYDGSYGVMDCNFGQRPFAYTAPSGFKALCTQNLPEPTIVDGAKYFGTLTWNGDDTARTITSGSSGVDGEVDFTPGFTWIKRRNGATNGSDHLLLDVVRGVGTFNGLSTNGTEAEGFTPAGSSWQNFGDIQSFATNGFTVQKGTDPSHTYEAVNETGGSYVGWNWKANGAGVSNTDGDITSMVSVSVDSGFSIVTYTGNGSANQTVGHGLGVAPVFGILKDRDTNSNNNQWQVFNTVVGDDYAYLSTTAAFTGTAEFYPTSASSTTVTIGRGVAATTNESGDRFVMYLFAAIPGYSAFGSYTGNGSADGPFVYLGFRPAFVLVKSSTSVRSWLISDGVRNPYNVTNLYLIPNSSDAEGTNNLFDFTSNGFKVRDSLVGINESSETFIYAAFAENPFKYSLAR